MTLVTIPGVGRFKPAKSGHIHLKCRRCKATRSNMARADWDHPDAVAMVLSYCPRCDKGGEFEDVAYFDADGKELSPAAMWGDEPTGP